MSLWFSPRRRAVIGTAVGLTLCALALTGCGGDDDNEQSTAGTEPAVPFPTALTTVPPILTDNDPAKAAPRWEQVRVVTGNAPIDLGTVRISERAFQWRVKWQCEVGTMKITSTPPPVPGRPNPNVVKRPCPG